MDNDFLKAAAIEAIHGSSKGDGGPFGAVIVDKSGNVISRGHNEVLTSHDPTNHESLVSNMLF